MASTFTLIDYIIVAIYGIVIIGVGLWVSRPKKGHVKTSEDYFLASKSLPWWAIGASLIAANISAEQFIGMSGSGFAIGLAIASYEWMAAITLIIVGKFFLPIFIEKKIYTVPEFIEHRFSKNMKTILAIFWLALFVFVNLTSVMYLGAKAIDTIIGTGNGELVTISILSLALFAAVYSLYGGLAAVAWTDVIQVVILIIGGLFTTFITISYVSPDGTIIEGFKELFRVVPEKFSMIIEKGEVITPSGKDAWWDLPRLGVLIGGLWVANLYYWGFNQYIIQRTFAAKNIREAQKGVLFAGFLKLIIPLIVVIPGIIAFYLYQTHPEFKSAFVGTDGSVLNDNAYPWLVSKFIPVGVKGLVLAALAAAILSSLASMLNSTATIFTMDIYKPYINKKAKDKQMVTTGRVTALVALIIAVLIAPQLQNVGQVFQYIQEYTGVVSPGILAVFLAGLFWKQATNKGAIWGVLASIPIALYFKFGPNGWSDNSFFLTLPFMHQMMTTCILSFLIIVLVSFVESKGQDNPKAIILSKKLFETSKGFNVGAIVIILITAMLYIVFW